MTALTIAFAWTWFLAGALSGAVLGLGFHKDAHMGGYGSWPRRMTRLGHIAFFGTGFLCLAHALSAQALPTVGSLTNTTALLLIAGAVAMPAVCFLCAWRKPLRLLFPVPVILLTTGSAGFCFIAIQSTL